MDFYVMDKLRFISSYAYGEDVDPVNLEEGPGLSCPVCGRPIGWKKWLQPKRIKLEKPKYGTFVYGTFDTFLVSEVFREMYETSGMTGINFFDEVMVTKVGYMRENSPKPPRYYHIEVKMTETELDEERSNFIWEKEPTCRYCRGNGKLKDFTGHAIKEETWTGEDVFYARGHWGTVVVTEKFKAFCEKNQFTNYKFERAEIYIPSYKRKRGKDFCL